MVEWFIAPVLKFCQLLGEKAALIGGMAQTSVALRTIPKIFLAKSWQTFALNI